MSVKLVSEVGVGTVAAGVAKANADHVLIAGHDGGTGASPLSSIQAAGIPWEIGLAETQQTLVLNDLRSRIWVQTDGQLKTGRDVVVAALLGADECGFSTAPLIATGCIMMRACHLNTCPVGIATQDPELRKRFKGQPEHVVNFFFFVAEEARELMRRLGIRTLRGAGRPRRPARGRRRRSSTGRRRGVDLTHVLADARRCTDDAPRRRLRPQDSPLPRRAGLDADRGAPRTRSTTACRSPASSTCATSTARVGGLLSQRGHQGARRRRACRRRRSATRCAARPGSRSARWLAPGVELTLIGDANDYTGKGLSGGVLAVRPPEDADLRGRGERRSSATPCSTARPPAARSSAGSRASASRCATRAPRAVVEGVGDHGCEYMTGGRAVILGRDRAATSRRA